MGISPKLNISQNYKIDSSPEIHIELYSLPKLGFTHNSSLYHKI